MSDKVIRLSGSQAENAASIQNLVKYIKRSNSRTFIVVSSVAELQNYISESVGNVFRTFDDTLAERLNSVYSRLIGSTPPESYTILTDHVSGILKGISLIGDYSAALKDQILSFGEKLTAEIFKAKLKSCGLDTEILCPEDIDLRVTSDFGNVTFVSLAVEKISNLSGKYYLIPGSYGITEEGKTGRAGRTAADYTAAFLTQTLNVPKLELWGLRHEFRRADPSVVEDSPVIERLTYSEASELAYFEHYSFHPRTVEPLEAEHIPAYIINTESDEGNVDTVINTETFVEPQIVKSVACTDDISLLRLNGPGVGLKPGILAKVTSRLNKERINIKSVITSQISINILLEKKTAGKALELIRGLGFSAVRDISAIEDVSLVAVIGHGMQQSYGVSAKIFSAVARHKINVVLSGSGASDLVSYLIVKSTDKDKSVREIYKAFF